MKLKIAYYLQSFLAFFSFSYVSTQILPFLNKQGFSFTKQGMVIAGIAIVSTFGQILFGFLCDHYHCMKRFLLLSYGSLIVFSFAMFLVEKQTFYYYLFICSFVGGFAKVMQGLVETYSFQFNQTNYPKVRAFGAIGFTIGALISGRIVSVFSFKWLTLGLIAIMVIWFFSFIHTQDIAITSQFCLKDLKTLFQNKRYMTFLLIFFLIYFVGNADQYIVIDKLIDLDASHDIIAMKWAIQSLMEVPLLLMANRILKKIHSYYLLIFSVVMYGLKFFLYGFVSKPLTIVMITFLQVVTLPIVSLVSKIMIEDICDSNLKNTAQMFAMAIFVGLSGLFTPFISSYVVHYFGYDISLYLFSFVTIIPFFILLILRKKLNPNDKS